MEQNNNFNKTLGDRIADLRKEIGLTQAQLAEKLNISQQLVANYEQGQRRIHAELLLKLSKILYVDLYDLLGIQNKKKKRGPSSKIQRKLIQIESLPGSKQKTVLELLDSFLQTAGKDKE